MKAKRTASVVIALGLALSVGSSGALLPQAAASQAQASVKPRLSVVGLEVNHLTDRPMGIDDAEPVFCWGMESNIIGAKQKSYRIEVSKNRAFTQRVWGSGTVASDESTDIRYGSTGAAQALTP